MMAGQKGNTMIEKSYKVTFMMHGSTYIYGHADTIEQAKAMVNGCRAKGWLNYKLYRYDEDSGNWIVLDET